MTVERTFAIGGDMPVDRIGFGVMRLTGQPGNFGAYPDWAGGVALLRRAADLGVVFFDSAHAYGPEHADRLLGEALADREVVLATKGGVGKPEAGRIVVDGSRDALLRQVDAAIQNLRRPRIDLFQLHRIDPNTPVAVSVAALAEAQADGRVRHIGLSNVTLDDLDRATGVARIASVQNRYNMAETEAEAMVDATAERGIAFIPYGPLGANPMRAGAPLDPTAALGFLMRRAPNIVAIPGTTSTVHLAENVAAWAAIELAAT